MIAPLPGSAFPGLEVGTLEGHPTVGVLRIPARMGDDFFRNMRPAVEALAGLASVRCILLLGQHARHFSAGIDLGYLQGMMRALEVHTCPARMREAFRTHLLQLQDGFTALERCKWPVVAAVHGSCVGGGVDLITTCDIRVCSQDASFCVKEVDLGITADLGTLQRLPHIIGHGAASDLALTCRTVGADEALRLGLVTQVVGGTHDELHIAAARLAVQVAAKSPVALVGTKRVLRHTRDGGGGVAGGVAAGLEYVATYNAAFLFSDDLTQAVKAAGGGRGGAPPTFSKL